MNVTILPGLGVTRVELEGGIDGKTAPQIREKLSPTLQQAQKLVIDMSRVDYLSSAGLRPSFFTLADSQQEALHAFAA